MKTIFVEHSVNGVSVSNTPVYENYFSTMAEYLGNHCDRYKDIQTDSRNYLSWYDSERDECHEVLYSGRAKR